MTADLNNEATEITNANDSIVIKSNLESIEGGRTLDVVGYPATVIKAGHVLLKSDSSDSWKPMPVVGTGGVKSTGALTAGSGYTNDGTYTGVALTGGSGSGAKATIVVDGNKVTSATITTPGSGYQVGDNLSAAAADIGTSGSGFKVIVGAVDSNPTAYDSKPSGWSYAGILVASILTAKPFAGILVRGTVNPAAAPFDMSSILSAVKTALPLIQFRED